MKKITLFIGLNDKDTKSQVVKTSEALEILGAYIVKNLDNGWKLPGVDNHRQPGRQVAPELHTR